MSNLIRDFNDKQQKQYASNLEMPKVAAPALQDAAPVSDEQFQVAAPQAPSLQQMTAPDASALQQFVPQYDATAEFNQRLSRQLPTLLSGQPNDAEMRSSAYYDWLGGQIEENRKRNAAQAIVAPSLQQFNTPTKTQPNGFGSNVLKFLFGGDKTDVNNDGIEGNEFDFFKGNFGQYGNGVVGGLMYGLDNYLGLGILRNSLLDTGANLASQAAGWAARGGVIDTLFKSGDVGKALIAGNNRQKQALQNIYGDSGVSFLAQGLIGRDLGALGNLSGDSHDDYRKQFGSSPAAAGLDRAFFGRELTEQETKDYEKLTGYSVKEFLSMGAGGENPMFERSPEEDEEYQQILGRVPEDFKTKMMLRNLTGLVADIKTDDMLKPFVRVAPKRTPAAPSEQLRLGGAPERLQLEGTATVGQRALPPKERNTAASDQYMSEWLRTNDVLETRPIGASGTLRGGVLDPWVTIDATAVRVPDALPGSSPRGLLPEATARTLTTPAILPESGVVRSALPTEQFMKDLARSGEQQVAPMRSVAEAVTTELRTSSAKSMVVSPSLEAVRTPMQLDVENVLRQQYMRRVEPGQYILQRLGTVADSDPVIAAKVAEPSGAIENARRLALPPAKTPTTLPNQTPSQALSQNDALKIEQFKAEDAEVQKQIQEELRLKEDISTKPRSVLPKNEEVLAKGVVEDTKPQQGEVPTEAPKPPQEIKPKLIPSSKEELLRQARERLNAEKAQRQGIEQPKTETNESVVKSEVAKQEPTTPKQGETPKQRMLREAKERLDSEKAARRLEAAVSEGFAKPVEGNAEVRVDVETPKGQELLNDSIDFDTLFNKTYNIDDLDTMVSMVARAAGGAPISFVGKVAPIAEMSRSQKEIYRFASLVPSPTSPGKPLLAPTKSMVDEYQAKYGVPHPYASSAIADSSMKYLTKNGGARRHKSLSDLAAEQVNPLYRKILSPQGTPIPLAVIERFEKQMSQGQQALVKTSSDTVSVIEATPKVDTPSQVVVRNRAEAQKFIDDNKLGIKKNASADKLNEYLAIYESKGLDAVPEAAFTKAGLKAREAAKATTESPTVEPKREVKVTAATKKVVKTETLEDFEDAVVKLEDLEPTLAELEAIQKKVSSLPIFDHRKKLAAPSHTPEVLKEAQRSPEVAQKQEELSELTTQLEEVVVQEQELLKVKQSVEVAIDNVDAMNEAEAAYFMKKYGLPRADASEFQELFAQMKSREGVFVNLAENAKWQPSRKAVYKGIEQVGLSIDDLKIAPNYEQLRKESLAVGEYEKAAAWFYQNSNTNKATTNPVVKIDASGNFEFISGRGTFLAAMDNGVENIPVQLLEDARIKNELPNTTTKFDLVSVVEVLKKNIKRLDAEKHQENFKTAYDEFIKNPESRLDLIDKLFGAARITDAEVQDELASILKIERRPANDKLIRAYINKVGDNTTLSGIENVIKETLGMRYIFADNVENMTSDNPLNNVTGRLFSLERALKKTGKVPLNVELARSYGATVTIVAHGHGDDVLTWTGLTEALNNPRLSNEKVIAIQSCMTSCERVTWYSPNQYILDKTDSKNYKVFNTLTPELIYEIPSTEVQVNPIEIVKELEAIPEEVKQTPITATTSQTKADNAELEDVSRYVNKVYTTGNDPLNMFMGDPSMASLQARYDEVWEQLKYNPNTAPTLGDFVSYIPGAQNMFSPRLYNALEELLDRSLKLMTPEQVSKSLQELGSWGTIEVGEEGLNSMTDLFVKYGQGQVKYPKNISRTVESKPQLPEEFKLFEKQEELWKEQEAFDFDSPQYDEIDLRLDKVNEAIDNLSERSSRIARYKKYKETGVVEQLPSERKAATPQEVVKTSEPTIEDVGTIQEQNLKVAEILTNSMPQESTQKLLSQFQEDPSRQDILARLFHEVSPYDAISDSSNKLASPEVQDMLSRALGIERRYTTGGDELLAFERSVPPGELPSVEAIEQVISKVLETKYVFEQSADDAFSRLTQLREQLERTGRMPLNAELAKQKFGVDSTLVIHGSGRTLFEWNAVRAALENPKLQDSQIIAIQSCQTTCSRYTWLSPNQYILDKRGDTYKVFSSLDPSYGVEFPKSVAEDWKAFQGSDNPRIFSTEQNVLDFFNDLPVNTPLDDINTVAANFGYRSLLKFGEEFRFESQKDLISEYKPSIDAALKKKLLSKAEAAEFNNFLKTLDLNALPKNLEETILRIKDSPENLSKVDTTLMGSVTNGILFKLNEVQSVDELKTLAKQYPNAFRFVVRKKDRFMPPDGIQDLVLGIQETLPSNTWQQITPINREPISRQNLDDALRMVEGINPSSTELVDDLDPEDSALGIKEWINKLLNRDSKFNTAVEPLNAQGVEALKKTILGEASIRTAAFRQGLTINDLENAVTALAKNPNSLSARSMFNKFATTLYDKVEALTKLNEVVADVFGLGDARIRRTPVADMYVGILKTQGESGLAAKLKGLDRKQIVKRMRDFLGVDVFTHKNVETEDLRRDLSALVVNYASGNKAFAKIIESIDAVFTGHGIGKTFDQWKVDGVAVKNLVKDSRFDGKRTLLATCQDTCKRYFVEVIPTFHVYDGKTKQFFEGNVVKRDAAALGNTIGGIDFTPISESGKSLAKMPRTSTEVGVPSTIGEAVSNFRSSLEQLNKTGVMDNTIQSTLNNSVRALSVLKDKSYAEKAREVVRRLTGREAGEGKPFMSAAVEMLNDESRQLSRDEIADVLSYAIGTKDVQFAPNMDDAEVLRFGRMVAAAPETFSQFDHLYIGHGTGIVEHGNWSLEARPSAGYSKRELVQHVIDNNYPRGTEVGVAACETGCPKRIQDSVPPLHRVVSRGTVQGSLDNLQRLIEGLSDMPTNPKVMDVLAEYDGLMREALNANKQRGASILQRMSELEDEFNDITKRSRFANEQRTRAQIKQAQASIEKDLLGDC